MIEKEALLERCLIEFFRYFLIDYADWFTVVAKSCYGSTPNDIKIAKNAFEIC